MIIELSAPVIKLKSTTALLPLVGEIDTNRAKVILESTLKQCAKLQINHLYIDLLGVPVVDTMVAHQLFQMINALKLIGVSTSLSGVSPSIAQTTIQLGIDFKDIKTYSSIEQAMSTHNNH
ncbi:STAS domain-containing protein [Psychrobacillus sp. INOP01]|nr:STAS domain-containing protein [Psychrobacillus sp. INOP01]